MAALALYGLATLYSAGQTDVPTFVATIWHRQLVWLGLSLVLAGLTFRTSPRMLEWATPFVYGIALFLLVLTLFIGAGAGTAAGSKSWLAIGGHRFGQPAELAKLAVILMLSRQLAAMREAPATLNCHRPIQPIRPIRPWHLGRYGRRNNFARVAWLARFCSPFAMHCP